MSNVTRCDICKNEVSYATSVGKLHYAKLLTTYTAEGWGPVEHRFDICADCYKKHIEPLVGTLDK